MGWILKEAEVRYRKGVRLDGERKVTSSCVVNEVIHAADAELCCASGVEERCIALALDARNRIIGWHLVGKGGVTSCDVTPAAVFRPLIMIGAVGVVLVHNHPSGEAYPSADDVALTERLRKAADLLSLRFLDHVIVTAHETRYFSFLDAGLLGAGG